MASVSYTHLEVCNAIIETKKAGNRVIAVGTTSVRSVETAALSAEENGLSLIHI